MPTLYNLGCTAVNNYGCLTTYNSGCSVQPMNLSLRIKQTRKEVGLTQAELSTASGVSQQMISKLETGKSSETADLVPLASALGVYAEWLFSGKGPKWINKDGEPPNVEPGPDIRGRCPLISWVQAGNWCEVVDNFEPGDAEDWLPCTASHGPHTYILRVRGPSMTSPQGMSFPDGILIFVDPDRQPEPGQFVVAKRESSQEATFKRFMREGDRLYLEALNPAWPERYIPIDESITICGVVISYAGNMV